jgi:hypothetical protein
MHKQTNKKKKKHNLFSHLPVILRSKKPPSAVPLGPFCHLRWSDHNSQTAQRQVAAFGLRESWVQIRAQQTRQTAPDPLPFASPTKQKGSKMTPNLKSNEQLENREEKQTEKQRQSAKIGPIRQVETMPPL